jgi:hypothetical protein
LAGSSAHTTWTQWRRGVSMQGYERMGRVPDLSGITSAAISGRSRT